MKRFCRWILNAIAIVCFIAFLAVVALWVRSRPPYDGEWIHLEHTYQYKSGLLDAGSARGAVGIALWGAVYSQPDFLDHSIDGFWYARDDAMFPQNSFHGFFCHWRLDNTPGFREAEIFISVPDWLVLIIVGAYPGWRLFRYLSRRRRYQDGMCPSCGYDLRATPDRCPECGKIPETAI
jgi:hypothetical protein